MGIAGAGLGDRRSMGLDMSHIVTYVRPNTKMTAKWADVPQDIEDTC